MITKELGKKILLTILWLVVVTLLVLPLFINKEDKQELKRLDEISNRLSDIWLQIEDINWQIVELESQKDVLIAEQTDLNEEAQTIFLSLVTPKMVEPQEEQVAWWASIWPVEEEVNVDQLYKCAHWDWEIYRNIKWRCNSEWMAQDIPALQWSWRHERMKELLNYYWAWDLYDTFIVAARAHRVYPELWICIAKADTSLGKALKTQGNIGNVWNTDSWATKSFDNNYIWVWKIFETLNNQLLGWYQTVDQLSRKFNKTWKIYAGSEENWHNNVMNCLWVIYDKTLPDNWNYRF